MTKLLICLHFFAAVGDLVVFMPLFITALVAARTDGSGPSIHQVLRRLRLSKMTTGDWFWAGFNMCYGWWPAATPITRLCFKTPKHTSWMKQVKIRFSILVRKLLKRASFTSKEDIKTHLLEFIDCFSGSPPGKVIHQVAHGLVGLQAMRHLCK